MNVSGREIQAVWWVGDGPEGHLAAIDQRVLPHRLETVTARNVDEVVALIRTMAVRGAPTIGATAAYGMVLGRSDPKQAMQALAASRPTARDLFTALEWMRPDPSLDRAHDYVARILDRCRRIGSHGSALLSRLAVEKERVNILTHCHAGALATVDHGTALAPVHAYAALRPKVAPFVWVDETRPRLQGAITAWELGAAGIAHRVAVDSAAGILMARGEVDVVLVGADRIAANGDVANKVGTYVKAVLARENGVPFYVAAPSTTFDLALADGTGIRIEERDADEVLRLAGTPLFAAGTAATNPAFDVTPARYVTGYITELGVLPASGLHRLAPPAESVTVRSPVGPSEH